MARDSSEEFGQATKLAALERQECLCAMCASLIVPCANKQLISVAWGETAHAHHRRPMQQKGKGTVDNCVIVCRSCHYSAHFGGNYGKKIIANIEDFRFFFGTKGGAKP
jgi:hypothetical protein